MRRLVFLSIFLSGCSTFEPPEEWRLRDTALEVSFQIVNALDARSTQRIAASPYQEVAVITRAVLGPKPDAGETAAYFAVSGLTHYLIGRSLPPKWRKWWQAGTLGHSAYVLENNCDIGLC
jgi:hypothetical protein